MIIRQGGSVVSIETGRQRNLHIRASTFHHAGGFESHVVRLDQSRVVASFCAPVIERAFSSPMCRWENLNYAGDWLARGCDDMAHLRAVAAGLKPMGRILVRNPEEAKLFDCRVMETGLQVKIAGNKRLFWRDERRIGDMFDLDALLRDYRTWNNIALELGLSASDMPSVESEIAAWSLDTIGSLPATLPEINPDSDGERVLRGLLFGYPPVTTADSAWRIAAR